MYKEKIDRLYFPGRNKNLSKFNDKLEINVKCTFAEELKNIELLNQEIQKVVSTKVFENKSNVNIEDSWTHKQLLEILETDLKDKSGFIICNIQVGTILQEVGIFDTCNVQNFFNNVSLYEIGKIAGFKIFVDPFMLWSDSRFVIIYNKFYDFKLSDIENNEFRINLFFDNIDCNIYNILNPYI